MLSIYELMRVITLTPAKHFRECFFRCPWSLNCWKHMEHWNCRFTPHSYLKCRIRLFLFRYLRPHSFGHTQRLSDNNNKNMFINIKSISDLNNYYLQKNIATNIIHLQNKTKYICTKKGILLLLLLLLAIGYFSNMTCKVLM